MKRIGIFSGSFDPVHNGHIALARGALKKANLDGIYFAPEIQPRRKTTTTHIAHRLAMLRLVTADMPGLEVLELPDKHFSVSRTLPRLKKLFPDAELYYVAGNDMLEHMPGWKLIERMIQEMGLVVGMRNESDEARVRTDIARLPVAPRDVVIIKSPESNVSSSLVRQAISTFNKPKEVDVKVQRYIDENWLYHVIES